MPNSVEDNPEAPRKKGTDAPRRWTPTTWNGVSYRSFADAYSAVVSAYPDAPSKKPFYREFVRTGSMEEALAVCVARRENGTVLATEYRGVRYPSLRAACHAASIALGSVVSPEVIYGRVHSLGWPIESAAETPVDTDQPGLVYMMTHRPTGKSYIGKTKLGGLDERICLHITSARSGQNDNGTLHYYLRTDGIESFDVKVLEEYTPTARATQRRYIQKFDTFNTGLNRTKGGHRGGSGRRILFKGAWYEGFSDLVEKNLGKDALALISRGYSLLRDHAKAKEAVPSDELIERALALIAAEVPPSVLSLYRPLPLSYAGQQYTCFAELVSEQVPSTPLDKMVHLMRCVEKALPDAALHEVEALLDKGLDAVLDPWRTLRQVENGLASEGAAFDVHTGNLGRRIRRLLDQKPLNLSFQRELKALLGGYLTREGRLQAPHHWRAQLKAWESHKKSPSFESADWAAYVMWDYIASLDTKEVPSLQWALEVRYRLREICGTHLTKKLRSQVMSPKVSLPRVHPKIKKEFFLRAARERVHGRISAYFFEGAQAHLRAAQFPLPRAFGVQDLVGSHLVRTFSVHAAFQLPLRTTLKLLTHRRRAGWLPTIDQALLLESRCVQWCARRKKYQYFDAGFEVARMLSREARQERLQSMEDPNWLDA